MSNTLNTTTLVDIIAESHDLTKKVAREIVDSVLQTIVSSVVAGDRVALSQFGIFEAADTAARTGRNPATGEDLEIPASKRVSFKASKAFKEAVKATA